MYSHCLGKNMSFQKQQNPVLIGTVKSYVVFWSNSYRIQPNLNLLNSTPNLKGFNALWAFFPAFPVHFPVGIPEPFNSSDILALPAIINSIRVA